MRSRKYRVVTTLERVSNRLIRFALDEVRDAPDRPGREFVFIARRPS